MKKLLLHLFVTFVLVFSGCGGGGGSGGWGYPAPTSEVATVYSGIFVDAPVEGLKYTTSSNATPKYTTSEGNFTYLKDENITFYIGNLTLGTVKAEEVVTPLDLAGDTSLGTISTKAKNIARLLQTLDSNRGLAGATKIKLNVGFSDLPAINITTATDNDLKTVLTKATEVTGINYTLTDVNGSKRKTLMEEDNATTNMKNNIISKISGTDYNGTIKLNANTNNTICKDYLSTAVINPNAGNTSNFDITTMVKNLGDLSIVSFAYSSISNFKGISSEVNTTTAGASPKIALKLNNVKVNGKVMTGDVIMRFDTNELRNCTGTINLKRK